VDQCLAKVAGGVARLQLDAAVAVADAVGVLYEAILEGDGEAPALRARDKLPEERVVAVACDGVNGQRGQVVPLGIGQIENPAGTESERDHGVVARLCLAFDRGGAQNRYALRALLDLPAERLPGAVAGHAPRVGALHGDQHAVVRAVAVEAAHGLEVAGQFGALRGVVRFVGEALHPLVDLGEMRRGRVGRGLGGHGRAPLSC